MIDNKMENNRCCAIADMLDALAVKNIAGAEPVGAVCGITADSREVVPGGMFVAVRGVAVDGHKFLDRALAAGARVVVVEELPANLPNNVTAIVVPESREALGRLASRFYGDPSEELTLVGVTGTNGKTTIATLLYNMARMSGMKAGLISTVALIIGEDSEPSEHTTPDAVLLNATLRRMVDAGCTFAAMEVSSHAADQHRIAGLNFAGGIFTNITRDHLDYHKTFDAYLKAKKSFFDGLSSDAFALTNVDDRNGMVMLQNTRARKATYSIRDLADYMVRVVEDRLDGMLLSFDGDEVETMFVGRFNASNLAAVYGASLLLGFDRETVLKNISAMSPVAGRFQPFRSKNGITAIVDYAHTPDALVNVLDTICEVAPDGAKVITVAGAGGNRDHGKRPLMAAAAAERSDILILTSDNPRNEEPLAIINDMLAGLSDGQKEKTECVVDRKAAIRKAVEMAVPGDVILIAGKGHETEQIIGDVIHHFDDRQEICEAFDDLIKD